MRSRDLVNGMVRHIDSTALIFRHQIFHPFGQFNIVAEVHVDTSRKEHNQRDRNDQELFHFTSPIVLY